MLESSSNALLADTKDIRSKVVPLRILLVEDNEPFRNYLVSLIRSQPNLQVIFAATDGLEAVRKADELHPDLILMDIGLSSLNGIDAARQIRLTSHPRILFVSAIHDAEVAGEALSAGEGYLVKSDVGSELFVAVDAVMHDRQFISSRLAGSMSPDVP